MLKLLDFLGWLQTNKIPQFLLNLKYVVQVVDIFFSFFHVELIGVLVIARNSPLLPSLSNPIMQIWNCFMLVLRCFYSYVKQSYWSGKISDILLFFCKQSWVLCYLFCIWEPISWMAIYYGLGNFTESGLASCAVWTSSIHISNYWCIVINALFV